jgi:CRISPR-associated protein (TIGR03984 family)
MQRTLQIALVSDLQQSVTATLKQLADAHQLRWALIHTSEGVVWGEYDAAAKQFDLSSSAFPDLAPAPVWETLLQARLFNTQAELLLWYGPASTVGSGGEQWQWRLYSDSVPTPMPAGDTQPLSESLEYYDETYMLWGTRADAQQGRFMRLAEGAQGIVHAPPVATAPTETQRRRLHVRHYLRPDANGLMQVDDSRLVALQA